MIRRKTLPKKRHKGLYIYCSKCRAYFSYTIRDVKDSTGKIIGEVEPKCKETEKVFSKCDYFDKHKYKALIHIPGTHSGRVSKSFDVTRYDDAVIKTIEFKKEVEKNILAIKPELKQSTEIKSTYLFNAQIAYIDFLDNIDVPQHLQVQRTPKYIKEQSKCLELFNEALALNNINKKYITMHKITDTHVGYYHAYLLEHNNYSNRTYNHKMASMKRFFQWVIDKYKLKIYNPFEKIRPRSTKTNKATITATEFKNLIDPKNMCPENGHVTVGTTKIKRNFYRDYLVDGIELCLHTGGRREEVVELRWNMVHKINGEIAYIEFNNLKVERIKGDGFNDNVDTVIIPITRGLKKVLLRLGYEKHKDSSEYLLCPDRSEQSTRTIMDNLSKGFTHYYKKLNTGRELQLKCLRKTYLSHLNNVLKGDAKKLSSHTTDSMLQKHYIDERIISTAVAQMSILED